MDGFEIHHDGNRVEVVGELDADTGPRLADALGKFGEREVTVDIAGVTFIDSSGIRILLVARQANPEIRVVGATPQALRVFDIAGVSAHILGT